MLFRQWRSFATVAEEGSVVLAAARLRLAQPALSRQMQNLERTVGTPLLVRGPRGTRLTAAGLALLADVRAVFAELADTLDRVRLAADGRLGTVRIALSRTAMDSELLRRGLSGLGEQLPGIKLVLTEVHESQQANALRSRAADIAVELRPHQTEFPSFPLLELHIDSVLLPTNHPLANKESVDLPELTGEPFLLVELLGKASLAVAEVRRRGAEREELMSSTETVFSSVAAGKGWTLFPSSRPAPPGTVVRRLNGFQVTDTLVAVYRHTEESPAVAMTLEFLRRSMRGDSAASEHATPRAEQLTPTGSGLEPRHLQAIVAAAELRSVSLAAQRLSLTQSGLTRQLQTVEREIGAVLLRRTPGGVEMTAAGEVFRAGASHILALVDEAIARARAIGEGLSGRCVLAAISTEFTGRLIVNAINQIAQTHPAVTIELAEMLTPAQMEALRERRADLGIAGANVGITNDPDIEGELLIPDWIECALVAETHPLAQRRHLDPSELADIPFVFLERSAYPEFYDLVMKNLRDIGLVPLIKGSFNGPRALWRGAADLGGWTLGSRAMLTEPLAGMIAVPIRGLSIPGGMQLVRRRDEKNPTVLAVLDALRRARGPMASA